MQKIVLQIYAVLVALLGVGGLFIEGEHLFGIMNADIMLDVFRIILAAVLIYIGFFSPNARLIRGSLATVGILYIGLGLLALADPTLWGILPTGLTGFDVVFHLVTGAFAAIIALIPHEERGMAL